MARNIFNILNNLDEKQQVPVEMMFLNQLNDTIEKINNKPYPKSQTYKPSSLKCLRNMYYQNVGMPVDEDQAKQNEIIGICESGTHRHEDIQSYISKMKENGYDWEYVNVSDFVKSRGLDDLEIKKELKFETKLYNSLSKYGLANGMNFMTDGILKNNDDYYIFEFKTEASSKWYSRTFVDDNHLDQAISYCISFGLDKVIFVYENRDNCAKKAYMLNVSQKMKQELIDRLKLCNSYVVTNILPPKSNNKRLCFYCEYKNSCKKDKDKGD